jgi:hypothetical protein
MHSSTPLQKNLEDHRFLLAEVGRMAGLIDPVAFEPSEFLGPMLKQSVRGRLLPVGDVFVRSWGRDNRKTSLGVYIGARVYRLNGISFVRVYCRHNRNLMYGFTDFVAVARADYRRLYAAAVRCRRETNDHTTPPILPDDQVTTLWKNTIAYLDETNLRRIREFGGRPKRGLLLTGPPGNGKTSACRWLWNECRKRNWEWRLVTADAYAEARRECNPEEAVRELFTVERTGVVFFDDMDQALRNRDTVKETDDQSVFLNALDGIEIREGVAYVFTTNCSLDLIDRAFKRPGRIDIVMHFGLPTADLRRRLFDRWHAEIRKNLSIDEVITDTDGMSFAEMEEVKNLLVMHFVNSDEWDWAWAMEQFAANRQDFAQTRRVGFAFGGERRTSLV